MNIRSIRLTDRAVPILLALITLLSYGLPIPRLGFYWDDWPFAFLSHFYGPAELIRAFSGYRPFLGPVFFLTTSLFDSHSLLWQIFGLAVRFASAYACWWMLRQVWPERRNQALTVTLVFLVFPGFSQQWVALTHTNQEWIALIAYLFSIGLTARIVRRPPASKLPLIGTLLLMAVGVFSTEYFAFYEVLRLGVILLLGDPQPWFARLQRAARRWLPYLVLWVLYAAYLLSYYRSGQYQSYGMDGLRLFERGPLAALGSLAAEGAQTHITAILYAWNQAFNLFRQPAGESAFLTGAAVGLAGLLLVIGFRLKSTFTSEHPDDSTWAFQAIGLGVAGILAGRIPSWAAGLPFLVRYDFDRFFLSMMLGASLLTVGLIELFVRAGKTRVFFTGLLIALAMSTQYLFGVSYQQDYANQKNLLAQLMWRAPAIKDGTLLLTDKITAIPYESDLGLTAPLNWLYHPDLTSHQLPLMILYADIRLDSPQLPNFNPGQSILVDYRTARFTGNTSNSIVFYYPEVGCVKLVDPADKFSAALRTIPPGLIPAAPLSDLDRILPEGAPVWPVGVLGKEPAQSWCYFYQKGELFRQQGDWASVNQLGVDAAARSLRPRDPTEYMVFLEASLRLGDVETAGQWLEKYFAHRASTKEPACRFISLMSEEDLAAPALQFLAAAQSDHACPP